MKDLSVLNHPGSKYGAQQFHCQFSVTGLPDLRFFFSFFLVCGLRILRDSLEVVNVTIAPLKTKIVLNFTGNTFQTGKCKSDASNETRWKEALEHTGSNSFA